MKEITVWLDHQSDLRRNPPALWPDAGSAEWPPAGWFGLDADTWPRMFESWEKFGSEQERRKIRERQEALVCRACKETVASERVVRQHQRERHPDFPRDSYDALKFDYKHPRWTFDMLGFGDLWDGKPRGLWITHDPLNHREQQFEADLIELGRDVAHAMWAA